MNTQFIYFSLPLITTYINPEGIEKKDAGIFKIKHSLIKRTKIIKNNPTICCRTGKISGITVLDFDNADEYLRLIINYPELKECYTVKSPRGYHIYFNYNSLVKTGTNQLKNYLNVDTRNDNGIIIANETFLYLAYTYEHEFTPTFFTDW